MTVTKFLCSFSVAQFTLPGLLASQALHLACCPPGFAPAFQHPRAHPLPRQAQGCSLGSSKHLFCLNLVLSLIRMKSNSFKISLKDVLKLVSNTISNHHMRISALLQFLFLGLWRQIAKCWWHQHLTSVNLFHYQMDATWSRKWNKNLRP